MTDYIEREDAIEIALEGCNSEQIFHDIKRLPFISIIHCKDCVYFTSEKSGEHWNICRFYDSPKTEDGYCNDAEPKEDNK